MSRTVWVLKPEQDSDGVGQTMLPQPERKAAEGIDTCSWKKTAYCLCMCIACLTAFCKNSWEICLRKSMLQVTVTMVLNSLGFISWKQPKVWFIWQIHSPRSSASSKLI